MFIQSMNEDYDNKILILQDISKVNYVNHFSIASGKSSAYRMIFVEKGSGEVKINDRIYPVKECDIILLNSLVKSFSLEEFTLSSAFYTLLIKENELIEDFPPQDIHPIINLSQKDNIIECFEDIHREFRQKKPFYERYINSQLNCLILLIRRELNIKDFSELRQNDNPVMTEIKNYIDNSYCDNISIDSLASHFHVSKSYLAHSFKKVYGLSPINYLINVRITIAKHLLSSTNLTVFEVSQKVGYVNTNYFSILFRKLTGEIPSIFRLRTKRKI